MTKKNKKLIKDARRFLVSKKYSKALNCLQEVLRINPKDGQSWFLMGKALYLTENYEQALEAIKTSQSLEPDNKNIGDLRDTIERAIDHMREWDGYKKNGNKEPYKKLEGYSEGGNPIYHYGDPNEFKPALGDIESIELIGDHIDKYFGPIDMVWHERVSDTVHVDLHVVPATPEREYQILITSGMSDLPMNAPKELENCEYAELMLFLPANWPLSAEAFKNPNNYWPIMMLLKLARFPHKFNSWLWYGHSIPNGDPAVPYADNTGLCCALLGLPTLAPMEFETLKISEEKEIRFFALYFVYEEEMEFKLDNGADLLFEKFESIDIDEILDIKRENVCLN